MTPEERALLVAMDLDASMPKDGQLAECARQIASAIRAAEDEAWNAALLAAARRVNETDGDPDLIVKSLLRRSPSSAPGGGRP